MLLYLASADFELVFTLFSSSHSQSPTTGEARLGAVLLAHQARESTFDQLSLRNLFFEQFCENLAQLWDYQQTSPRQYNQKER